MVVLVQSNEGTGNLQYNTNTVYQQDLQRLIKPTSLSRRRSPNLLIFAVVPKQHDSPSSRKLCERYQDVTDNPVPIYKHLFSVSSHSHSDNKTGK